MLRETICRLRRFSASADDKRLNSLSWICSELNALNGSTEAEFLHLGEKLQDFHQRTKEISRISASTAGLMSGCEVADIINGFSDIAHQMEQWENESRNCVGILADILNMVSRIQSQLQGFDKIILVLRMLCVSTRIESSRLGERNMGFEGLANDVGKLAEEIDSKCSELSMQAQVLSQLISEKLSKILQVESRQHAQAKEIIDQTMSCLGSMREKHQLSSEIAINISTRFDAISRNISEIVLSMQVHDSTRQRIEHVSQALERLLKPGGGSGLSNPSFAKSGKSGDEIDPGVFNRLKSFAAKRMFGKTSSGLRDASAICGIQRIQLGNARDEFIAGVGNIVQNILDVARNVEDIFHEVERLEGATDQKDSSSLSDTQAGLTYLESGLKVYADANRELSLTVDSLTGMIGDMSAFATGITLIGTKIRLIALNAIVKACRIGEDGATLNVLAEAIHDLSIQTCHRTNSVAEALSSVTSGAAMLKNGSQMDSSSTTDELDRISKTQTNLMATLPKIREAIAAGLVDLNERSLILSNDISEYAPKVRVHDLLDTKVARIMKEMESLVPNAGSNTGANAGGGEHFEVLEASYTMEKERDLHRTALGAVATASCMILTSLPSLETEEVDSNPDAGKESKSEEDFGDNIELF